MADLTPNAQNLAKLLKRTISRQQGTNRIMRTLDGSYDTSALAKASDAYNNCWHLQFQWLIASPNSLTGKLMFFLHKLIRKILNVLLQPIFRKQTNFNGSMTWAMNEVIKNLESINQDLAKLKQRENQFKEKG